MNADAVILTNLISRNFKIHAADRTAPDYFLCGTGARHGAPMTQRTVSPVNCKSCLRKIALTEQQGTAVAVAKSLPSGVASMIKDMAAQPDRQTILIGQYHPATIEAADRRELIYPVFGGEHRLTPVAVEVAQINIIQGSAA